MSFIKKVFKMSDKRVAVLLADGFKERYDKKLSKAYLEGRYGAIPVFRQFSFRKGAERPGDVRPARTETERR